MRHRVAVTGMGVVSPLGLTVEELRDALLAGRSGIRTITVFDPASLPTRIAAEVPWNGSPILRDRKVTFAIAAARRLDVVQRCGEYCGNQELHVAPPRYAKMRGRRNR